MNLRSIIQSKNIGVFVVHALNGYELHEKRIQKIFDAKGIPFEFITKGDISNFKNIKLENYFSSEALKEIRPTVISCTLNHILAYEDILNRNHTYGIIFENDPFFINNFDKNFPIYVSHLDTIKPNFIISLENSTLRFPSYFQIVKNKYFYLAQSGRMAGAYIIDRLAIENILRDLQTNKCNKVIDLWHNDLIKRKIVTMYWAHPPIIEQGSHNGLLSGTISSKSASIGRRIAWQLQKNYKWYFKRFLNERRIINE